MYKISKFDCNLRLGLAMSKAHYESLQAKNVVNSGTDSKISQVANTSITNLWNAAREEEHPVARFFRKILNFLGIVTDYQKVINQVQDLDADINQSQQLQLIKVKEKEMRVEVNRLSKMFDENEAAIQEFRKRNLGIEKNSPEALALFSDIALYEDFVGESKEALNGIKQPEDLPVSVQVRHLTERCIAAEKNLIELKRSLVTTIDREEAPIEDSSTINPGGISNGWNTCYVASAMQVINNVEIYRNLFDAESNPLMRLDGETEASFERRKLIQNRGFQILKKIRSGTRVSGREIHSFREACYNHEVIRSLRGQEDAGELMLRLLPVLGYVEQTLGFNIQDNVPEDDFEVVNDGKVRGPEEYSSREGVLNYHKDASLSVNVLPYLGRSVSMGTLIQNFWAPEEIGESLLKHVDEATGDISYRKYKNIVREKTLDLNRDFPEAIQLSIPQLEGQKVTITNPETIYLSGQEGVGPRYQLAGIIQHVPGHYIAHINTPAGLFTANDSRVSRKGTSSISGVTYFYVLAE